LTSAQHGEVKTKDRSHLKRRRRRGSVVMKEEEKAKEKAEE
jgi:hypothetical protein